MKQTKSQEKSGDKCGCRAARRWLKNHLPLLTGLLALGWFLFRVIPKPQRATYPCMKATYPLMSGLVIWLLGVSGLSASLKLIVKNLHRNRLRYAFGSMMLLGIFTFILFLNDEKPLLAARDDAAPVHLANAPIGVPQGIIPGRVVWCWDPEATNENCTNDPERYDYYFLARNNNQEAIDLMVARSVLKLADENTPKETWDAIFRQFNKLKGKGDKGYDDTETVFVKINLGCAWSVRSNGDLTRKENTPGYSETSPQVVLSVLKQLVNKAGVPQQRIIVADPMSHIYQYHYEYMHDFFPDVNYGDRTHEADHLGRMFLEPDTVPVIFYSDKGEVHQRTPSECLYKDMAEADYLINIAALKAHACAGITLTAKNHFGSITRSNARHLHASLVSPRGNDRPVRVDYRMYRVFVDLMGSSHVGRNTLLFIVDGLWGGTEAIATPVKWVMEPFKNDWPSSIFVSLDQVALESVCFDFLRHEAALGSPLWKNRPNFAQVVDDYLHQAASSEYWPDGIVYDPDNSGTPIPSLGVHEHWNNPADKQYSRNLGKDEGIDLVKLWANRSYEVPGE